MSDFRLAMMPALKSMLRYGGRICNDPATAAIAGATVISAAGSIQSGNAQSASLKSQENADIYNSNIAKANAAQVGMEGTQRELSTRNNIALTEGEERAAVGQAGIGGPQGGTVANVLEQDKVNGELSALGVRYQTDTARQGDLDTAALDSYDASVARMNAHSAKVGGYIGAIGSVLGGANKYFGQQTALNNASVPTTSSGVPVGVAISTPSANTGYYQFAPNVSKNLSLSGSF